MRSLRILSLATLLLGLLGGCGKEEPAPVEPSETPAAGSETQAATPSSTPAPSQTEAATCPACGGPGAKGATCPACPMQVEGTEVAYQEIDGGGALVFTQADADRVPDVQRRVHAMAEHHDARCGSGGSGCCMGMGPKGKGGGPGMGRGPGPNSGGPGMGPGRGRGRGMGRGPGPGGGGGLGPMPPTRATAVDTAEGARLEIVADDPTQADAVRQHLQRHAERIRSGQCPMMRGRGPQSP